MNVKKIMIIFRTAVSEVSLVEGNPIDTEVINKKMNVVIIFFLKVKVVF